MLPPPRAGRGRWPSPRLSALGAVLLLLALAARAGGVPEPVLARRSLEDFEGRGRWRGVAARPQDRIRLEVREDPGGERSAHALHVRFSFGDEGAGQVTLGVPLAGVDGSDFDHLALWIRGDAQAGFGPTLKIRVHRGSPDAPRETGTFLLDGIAEGWQRFLVPLGRMPGITEWKDLSEFVLSIQARRVGVAAGAYYLDDLDLVRTGHPGPSAADRVPTPAKRAWEREAGGPQEESRRLRLRLAGWPERSAVDPGELPADPQAFLWRLARDTWRGLAAFTDRTSGLPLDNVRFSGGSLEPADARIGDFTNVTNVGLHLMAISAARDLGLLEPEEALAQIGLVLGTLERLETHRGFFFNYYDTTSLERSSNFVSFVDSAWLTAGLLVTRSAFPEMAARCTRLVEAGDYAFFYDPVEQLMSHGYWTNLAVPAEYHYGLFYTEARLGSLIAIAKGDVPEEHWTRLRRGSAPFARTGAGGERGRGRGPAPQRWRGIAFVPSWGGSMFEALMPVLALDEPRLAPQTLGRNDEAHAMIQRRYALEELGYAVWGMSPSATPGSDAYAEYGAAPLGVSSYPAGVVAPYASALALAVTPAAAEANLRRLAALPGAYGDYGFYDAVDPQTGQVASRYLALDQSMLFLALANHLGGGSVRRHFADDPIGQRALPLVSDKRLLD